MIRKKENGGSTYKLKMFGIIEARRSILTEIITLIAIKIFAAISVKSILTETITLIAVRMPKGFSYTANVYRGLRGLHRFSLQYLWKRAVRITEKPYTPQRERLCML